MVVKIEIFKYCKFIPRHMRTLEFMVNEYNTKLGIIGELHLYNKAESEFGRKMLKKYNTVLVEGSEKTPPIYYAASALYAPEILSMANILERDYPTTTQMAKECGKEIKRLESKASLGFAQATALILRGVYSILSTPITRYKLKKYGDPYIKGGSEYHLHERKSLINKFDDFAFGRNRAERDKIMAKNAIEIIKKKDALVVFGINHLGGFLENIKYELDLTQITDIEI